eukprot:c27915_g2_i1 orf=912-3290(-)
MRRGPSRGEMGSLKQSVRSKSANSQQLALVNGTVPLLQAGVPTNEMRAFHADKFDANIYVQSKCQTMTEKGIRNLCSELLSLKKISAEEMRRSVYANYTAFIRTSQEISDLEKELLAMRNLLSNQVALVHGLAEGVQVENVTNGAEVTFENISHFEDDFMPSEWEKHAQALSDRLDVLLAERRFDEALVVLDEGEKIVSDTTYKEQLVSATASSSLQAAMLDCRARIAEQLVEAACQPSVRGNELRATIASLDKLGEGARAHTLLLKSHHERLQYNIQGLHPHGTSYGESYTAALSQLTFSAIAQAAKDSFAVFGEQHSYASEFMLWARNETENFAMLLKWHVLSPTIANGGLRAAAECVQIAFDHCSLLEVQGLALLPVLLKLFHPSVEKALEVKLKCIDESFSALAAVDDWVLVYSSAPCSASRMSPTAAGLPAPVKLSSSAHRFHAMVQDLLEDVVPLINLQLGSTLLDGLAQLFESYVELLMKAISGPVEDEGLGQPLDDRPVKEARGEAQQLGILCNASTLTEELLPRAAIKLFPGQYTGREDVRKRVSERHGQRALRMPDLKEWRRRLQRMVDRVRDHYCRQQVLDLVYTEEGETNLRAYLYLNWDANGDDPYWHNNPMPSPIFQELFGKLNKLAHVGLDILAGRERFAALLLMRIVETFLIWLSDDQEFWEDMEDSLRPLGAIGLQQFVLDMQFIIQIASHGHYLSRQTCQVTEDIITRAVEAFGRTGLDPNSVLPENEWFVSIAQDAMNKLLVGWSKGVHAELSSPTASVSAQSISSMRSNGSS